MMLLKMNLRLYKRLFTITLLFSLTAFKIFALKQNLFTLEYSKQNKLYKNIESAKTWNYIERAKREYDAGNLSETVVLANKANDINAEYYFLIQSKIKNILRQKSIKAESYTITDLYNKLYDIGEIELYNALDKIFLTNSIKSFSNSITNLLDYLEERARTLPESSYLIGLSFQAQGEFKQAKNYYELAWQQKDFLENPDEKLKILYSLADVSELLGNTENAEKFLLAILANDFLYANKSKASSQLQSMLKSLKTNEDTKKFFLLYRHDGSFALKAFQKLTELYYNAGNYKKALEVSACATCIVTTELERYIQSKNFLYGYKSLDDLILQTTNDIAVMDWANERNFWETYMQFASILFELNLIKQAENLYATIASTVPDYYIAQKAFYSIPKIRTLNLKLDAKN